MVIDDRWPPYTRASFYWPNWTCATQPGIDVRTYTWSQDDIRQLQTKAEKNQARLKQLRGRAGRWA